MADSQTKSSAADSKEQNALLDLDIGKDFLSSWKSISAADGDVMDFDLLPVSKGSKKPFNFEKADMDFNLDGDFGKLLSFDMDMSDLEISPPLKKDGKSNEKSKESSSANDRGKADRKFFDMDMSDLDISSPLKKDGKSNEKSKESSSANDRGKADRKFFDMDMSDLDISAPLKKDGKSNEKSNEPSGENDKGKADRFSFAFDFDELDNFNFEPSLARKGSKVHKDTDDMDSLENFNFDPSLTKESSKAQKDKDTTGSRENLNFVPSLNKEGSKAQKNEAKVESLENSNFEPSLAKEGSKTVKDKDAIGGSKNFSFEGGIAEEGSKPHKYKDNIENLPHKSVCQYMDSKQMNLTGSMNTLEDVHQSPSLLSTTITFEMDRQVGGSENVKPTMENYPSKLAIDEPVTSTYSAATEQVSVDKSKSHPEIVIASTEPPKAIQSGKSLSLDPVDHETSTGNGAKFFADSLSNNAPSGCNSSMSDAPEKSDCMDKISTASLEEKDANMTSEAGPNCSYKYKISKRSPHFHAVAISEKDNNDKSQSGIENNVMDNKGKTELGKVNSQVKSSCINNVLPEILTNMPTGGENQKHASEIADFTSVSHIPDKLLPDKETEKGETSLTRPSSAIQLEKMKASVKKTSLTQTTDFSLSSKNKGLARPNLVERRRNLEGIQSNRKVASLPMQNSKTLLRMELPQTKSRENCKGLEILGEKVPDIAGVQKMKILNDSFTQNLDLVKAKPALRQKGTSVKYLHTISSLATPPSLKMEMNKKTSETSNVHITSASLPATKRNPAETEKLSAAEGIKKIPELRSPKPSSLNLDSTKSPSQNEVRLAGNIRQTSVLLRNTPKCFAPLSGSEKKTPSPLSLKRKSLEEHNGDTVMLYPSKRVSQSPTLSRNFMETSGSAFDKKVSYKDSIEDDGITLGTCQVSATNILHTVYSKALEMSVYIENDSNIKQAEAYTKELDDICNKLRKKQDEAKELLVRATVNSNRVLMLNHHHIEQKIHVIQNSLATLSLNNIRA